MSNKKDDDSPLLIGAAIAGTSALIGGIIGYFLSTKNVVINIGKSIDENVKLKEEIERIDKHEKLEIKLRIIKQKINSENWVEVQGAVIVLFAELEKYLTDNILKKKQIVKVSFVKKINQAFDLSIITELECNVLKRTIPVRNSLVHGSYEKVQKNDIIGCEIIISDFLIKRLKE